MPLPVEGFTTTPLEWRFYSAEDAYRSPPLTEEDILDRLDDAQALLKLPPSVWEVLVEIIAPDKGLDAGDPPRPLGRGTDALPGTEEKIEVLAHRLRMGFELWHEDDADWPDEEEVHTEQVGRVLGNGAIKRTKCKVAHRDGASIMIPRDPEEAAEELRRHFRFKEMQELAGLLWEGVGYQPRKRQSPAEGFLVIAEKVKPERRRRRKRHRGEVPGQLKLFEEPEEVAA